MIDIEEVRKQLAGLTHRLRYPEHDYIKIKTAVELIEQQQLEIERLENPWISVDDALPNSETMKKYEVKIQVGSMNPKIIKTVVLGRSQHGKFRFCEGDWQKVLSWRNPQPLPKPPEGE